MQLPGALTPHKIWDTNDPPTQAIQWKDMTMSALDNQLFTVVEDQGLVDLMAHMQPKYCLLSRRYFSETMLPQVHEKYRAKAFDTISKAESFSFTSDHGPQEHQMSHMSLSLHWIDENFTRQSLVLSTFLSHTQARIYVRHWRTFNNWKMEENRCHYLVTDSATNMSLGSSSLVGIASVHCFIHHLQLVIHDTIFSQRVVKDMLAKTRRMVTHFNHTA